MTQWIYMWKIIIQVFAKTVIMWNKNKCAILFTWCFYIVNYYALYAIRVCQTDMNRDKILYYYDWQVGSHIKNRYRYNPLQNNFKWQNNIFISISIINCYNMHYYNNLIPNGDGICNNDGKWYLNIFFGYF